MGSARSFGLFLGLALVALAFVPATATTPQEHPTASNDVQDPAVPWLLKAQAAQARGEAIEALELARKGLTEAPESLGALLMVGRLEARAGALEEALATFSRARKVEPREPLGYLFAGLLLRDLGRVDKAAALLAEGYAATATGEPPTGAQREIGEQWGLLALASGDPKRAAELARELLTDPQDDEAKAKALRLLGLALAPDPARRQEAAEALEEALLLGVDQTGRLHLELGSLLLAEAEVSEEDRTRALDHLRRAREQLPKSPEAYYRLGNALRAAGDSKGARAALERFNALRAEDETAERLAKDLGTSLNEAQDLASANRLDEALGRLDALVKSFPQAPQVYALRAKVRFSRGRPDAALEDIAQARRLAPRQVENAYLEGFFLSLLGRPAEAEAPLRQALVLDPELGPAHSLLGGVSAKLGRHEEAVQHFQRALDLGADSPSLRLGYASALEALGREQESRSQMDAYERLRQTSPSATTGG